VAGEIVLGSPFEDGTYAGGVVTSAVLGVDTFGRAVDDDVRGVQEVAEAAPRLESHRPHGCLGLFRGRIEADLLSSRQLGSPIRHDIGDAD